MMKFPFLKGLLTANVLRAKKREKKTIIDAGICRQERDTILS